MVRVGSGCIDRWEISLVDKRTGRTLSPYYPPAKDQLLYTWKLWSTEHDQYGNEAARRMPLPRVPTWQLEGDYEPMAVSRANVVPQGYLSRDMARAACEAAGKRLCGRKEWLTACRGARDQQFPYGAEYVEGVCNVFRQMHPATVLHANSSQGHTDPRLNLIVERGTAPLLQLTGAKPDCASAWGRDALYDMVGNLDEWVEDELPTFVGGFYARSTRNGCEAVVTNHGATYYDYSTGTRCCQDSE